MTKIIRILWETLCTITEMRILIVSKSDAAGGGASAVAAQLNRLLNFENQSLHINLWRGQLSANMRALYKYFGKGISALRKLESRLGLVDFLPLELPNLLVAIRKFRPQIVHFHDLSSAISPISLFVISRFVPVVFTMHDVSPVTGGCLYPLDCDRFEKGCGNCPQLGIWPLTTKVDRTKFLKRIRLSVLKSENIFLLAPSKWLSSIVEKEVRGMKDVHVISNGVNVAKLPEVSDVDRHKTLSEFRLNPKRQTILIVASNTSDSRKGFSEASSVLRSYFLINEKFQIVLMGGTNQEAIDLLPKVPIYVAGFISDESDKLRLYSASDVLLFTSRADNQPLTILEALVSGIQIVGFEVGGLTELQMKYQGITLAQPGDEASVVRHLFENSRMKSTENIKSSTKNLASKTLSEHVFLRNHLEFYKKVIQNEK